MTLYGNNLRIYEFLLSMYDDGLMDMREMEKYFRRLFGEDFFKEKEFEIRYETYLASPEWKKKRAEIKDFYGNKCYICGDENNLEVHHIDYKGLGHETEYDTVCLCHDCHMKMHELKDAMGPIKPDSPVINCEDLYPRAHAWHKEMKEELYKMHNFVDSTFKKLKHAECMTSGGPIEKLTTKYVDLLGKKTIRQHLPRIGSIVGETCGFYSVGPCITSGIRSKLNQHK